MLAEAGKLFTVYGFRFIFILFVGKDATEAFEDVGHSDEARLLLEDLYVGDFEQSGVRSVHTPHIFILLTIYIYLVTQDKIHPSKDDRRGRPGAIIIRVSPSALPYTVP